MTSTVERAVAPVGTETSKDVISHPIADFLSTGWPEAFGLNARLGHVFESLLRATPGVYAPAAQLDEDTNSYVLEVDLPGIAKKDVSVEIVGRRITVHGERIEKERRPGIKRHSTRTIGSFSFEAVLPEAVDADKATADMVQGVLTVHLPKAHPKESTSVTIR